jgi:hypothetical protein
MKGSSGPIAEALLRESYVSLKKNLRLHKSSHSVSKDDVQVCSCLPAIQGGSSCSPGSQCLNRCARIRFVKESQGIYMFLGVMIVAEHIIHCMCVLAAFHTLSAPVCVHVDQSARIKPCSGVQFQNQSKWRVHTSLLSRTMKGLI